MPQDLQKLAAPTSLRRLLAMRLTNSKECSLCCQPCVPTCFQQRLSKCVSCTNSFAARRRTYNAHVCNLNSAQQNYILAVHGCIFCFFLCVVAGGHRGFLQYSASQRRRSHKATASPLINSRFRYQGSCKFVPAIEDGLFPGLSARRLSRTA